MTQLVEQKVSHALAYSQEHIQLIKNQICKGASDLELQLFLHVCQKTGLDPLVKQIYSVKYGSDRSIIVSIDGFRSVAETTGCYAPGRESTFQYDEKGRLFSATAYVKKMTSDGTWHEISESAHWDEYGSDKAFWKKMPRVMLSKCAEAKALRRAFPKQLGGLYTQDEMDQASKAAAIENYNVETVIPQPSDDQVSKELKVFIDSLNHENPEMIQEYIKRYAAHHNKTLWDAYSDYKGDHSKFISDFTRWENKNKVRHGK